MTPEERLNQAVLSVASIDRSSDIDRLIVDLEQVFEALGPEQQATASDVIEQLQDKRRTLWGDDE